MSVSSPVAVSWIKPDESPEERDRRVAAFKLGLAELIASEERERQMDRKRRFRWAMKHVNAACGVFNETPLGAR